MKQKIPSFFLCLLVGWPLFSLSQEPSTEQIFQEEQQRLRNQQEALERQRQLDEPDVTLQSKSIPPVEQKKSGVPDKQMPTEDTPCYIINQFVFEIPAAASLPQPVLSKSGTLQRKDKFYFLNKTIAFARGKCIGLKGIKFLVDTLLSELMQRGYVTTRIGVVPEQNLAGGILKFSLLPGYIGAFRFRGDVTTSIKTAFPAVSGDLLNLRDLEQGMEQLERVSSFKAAIQLEPGSAPGETNIVLTLVQAKPWHLSLSLDNSGNRTTGYFQGGTLASVDNMLGLNDVFSINVAHDMDWEFGQHGSRAFNTWYSLPWGNWTFNLNGSQYQSYYRRPNATQWPFVSTERQTLDGKIAWMFWRNQVQKNSVEFHVGRYWAQTSLGNKHWTISGDKNQVKSDEGLWLRNQYRNMTFAQVSYLHRHHFGPARLNITASYRWGVPWFGADSAGWQPAQQYNLKILDATVYIPFLAGDQWVHYTGTVRGQITATPQDGTNDFSIGSRWTVRGFDDRTSLAADQGYFLRNEFQIALGNSRQSVYYGLDIGSVFDINEALTAQKTLVGTALGLRGVLFSGFSYDLFAATPVYQPRALNSKLVLGFAVRQSF